MRLLLLGVVAALAVTIFCVSYFGVIQNTASVSPLESSKANDVSAESGTLPVLVEPHERESSDVIDTPASPAAPSGPDPKVADLDMFADRGDEFSQKYKDWDHNRLLAHRDTLAEQIGRIVNPIVKQKLAAGDYQEFPPFPKNEHFLFDAEEYKTPDALEPIISTSIGPHVGSDMQVAKVIVVFPEKHPELKPLCEEKDWLTMRLRELYQEEK